MWSSFLPEMKDVASLLGFCLFVHFAEVGPCGWYTTLGKKGQAKRSKLKCEIHKINLGFFFLSWKIQQQHFRLMRLRHFTLYRGITSSTMIRSNKHLFTMMIILNKQLSCIIAIPILTPHYVCIQIKRFIWIDAWVTTFKAAAHSMCAGWMVALPSSLVVFFAGIR